MSERPPRPPSESGAIRRGAKRALRAIGLDVHRVGSAASPGERRMAVIQQRGIGLVLDVGANRGQYALMLRRHGYRGRMVSFEPLAPAFEVLRERVSKDPAWECREIALGSHDGPETLNAAGDWHSSSLLTITEEVTGVVPEAATTGTQPVQVARLDTIWAEVGGSTQQALLKADVQGYELEVLRGAERSLASIPVLDLEVELVELYEGQPLLQEMLEYVTGLGYELFAFDPGFEDARTGRLMSVDALFVRD